MSRVVARDDAWFFGFLVGLPWVSFFLRVRTLDGGPQVEDVALDATFRIEAVEYVFVEVDVEGASLTLVVFGVDRTGATALAALAAQVGEESRIFEDAL